MRVQHLSQRDTQQTESSVPGWWLLGLVEDDGERVGVYAVVLVA